MNPLFFLFFLCDYLLLPNMHGQRQAWMVLIAAMIFMLTSCANKHSSSDTLRVFHIHPCLLLPGGGVSRQHYSRHGQVTDCTDGLQRFILIVSVVALVDINPLVFACCSCFLLPNMHGQQQACMGAIATMTFMFASCANKHSSSSLALYKLVFF